MGLLSEQTSHVPEPECAPVGEARLIVEEAEEKLAQTGRPMMPLVFSLPDYENAMNVYHNILGPKEGDKDKTRDAMLRGIGDFKKSLGFGPDDDVPTETLIGLECRAFLEQEEYQGRLRNKIKRFTYSQADETDKSYEGAAGPTPETEADTQAEEDAAATGE